MRRLILLIISTRFKEEVTDLACGHGKQPRQQHCGGRLNGQQHVADDKTGGTEEMQGLVHSTVMVVAMVVPALLGKCLAKSHRSSRHEGYRVSGLLRSEKVAGSDLCR